MSQTTTRTITRTIDRETARRVLEVVDAGLVDGMGVPEPGRMCVEAAVCYALGLPHGDEPDCVIAAGWRYKTTLNDAAWSSDEARAKGLRRAAVAQLGSKGVVDEQQWTEIVVEQTIRQIVPIALRAAGTVPANAAHRAALEAAAIRCEREGTKDAARAADYAAAATDYAADAADAARAADYAADAADAALAAAAAALATDYAAAATDYAADDDDDDDADSVLACAAEIAVQAFIACGSPGAAYLDLCPPECEEAER